MKRCRQAGLICLALAMVCLGGTGGGAAASGEPALRLGPVELQGSAVDRLEVGLGAFEPFDDDPDAAATVEYRFGRKLWAIGPALGLIANVEGGLYGYFGLYLEAGIGSVRVIPMLAVGGYHEGSGEDLGGVLQFRESLAIAWQLANGHQVGLKIGHISNGDIYEANPGAEELFLTYALPLGPVF
ncbi:MAG TPA: acyloxyacyl hydrolase [Geminicoccaceae bacterium]